MRISASEQSMVKIRPEILTKNGKKEFVILTYEEYVALQDRLADAEDLLDLRKAKRAEGKKKSVPLATAKRALGVKSGTPLITRPRVKQ
jgi:hypothetical protein